MIGRGGDKAARQDMFPTQVAEWRTEERVGGPPIGTGSSFDVDTVTNHVASGIRQLAQLRERFPALATGSTVVRYAREGVLIVSRFDREDRREYLVAFNASEEDASVTITTSTPSTRWIQHCGSDVKLFETDAAGRISVGIPALGAVVARADGQLPRRGAVRATLRASTDQFTNFRVLRATVVGRDPASIAFAIRRAGAKQWIARRRRRRCPVSRLSRSAALQARRERVRRRGRPLERRDDLDIAGDLGAGASLMAVRENLREALDGTGRRYAFRPAALLGNGSLLATISDRGEIERLFWPNVDHGQHLGELRLGVEVDGATRWLDEEPLTWSQSFADGASVLRTTARNGALTVEVSDLVTTREPVLARGVRSSMPTRLVVHVSPSLDGAERSVAGYVDPGSGALVFYLRGVALAVSLVAADAEATLRESNGHEVTHDVVVHRAPVDGTISGAVEDEALVLAAFGATPDEAIARLGRPAEVGFDVLASERAAYDRETIALAEPAAEQGDVCGLYSRSLLVLEQLTDRQTGATIAAPEFDPAFEQSGGYGFVWPRDLAYVVLSFLAAGRGDLAVPALRWLAREQAPEGLWLQRYWTDGSLAPSWGLHQLDETGVVVFAYEAAWRELGDAALDRELWPSARAAADFLCGFIDRDTGLPLPSVDLWEQTDGQHSYSAAATYGGLDAAAAMAARHEPGLAGALPGCRRGHSHRHRSAPLERGARQVPALALGRPVGRARRRAARDLRSQPAVSDAGCPQRRHRGRSRRQLAARPLVAVPRSRARLAPDARDRRRRGAGAPASRRRSAPPPGRPLRGRQPLAHLDAVARAGAASGRRRRAAAQRDRVRARAPDSARAAPGAGDPRRRPGVGRPARLEPRDAHPRGASRARARPRRLVVASALTASSGDRTLAQHAILSLEPSNGLDAWRLLADHHVACNGTSDWHCHVPLHRR